MTNPIDNVGFASRIISFSARNGKEMGNLINVTPSFAEAIHDFNGAWVDFERGRISHKAETIRGIQNLFCALLKVRNGEDCLLEKGILKVFNEQQGTVGESPLFGVLDFLVLTYPKGNDEEFQKALSIHAIKRVFQVGCPSDFRSEGAASFFKTIIESFLPEEEKLEIAEMLIKKKIDLSMRDPSLRTPLFIACSVGNVEMAELLIKNGAPVNSVNLAGGYTPLYAAYQSGSLATVKLLKERGAQRLENEGYHPFHAAYELGSIASVNLLNESDADLKSEGKGYHPFHGASRSGKPNPELFFLNRDIDCNLLSKGENEISIGSACLSGDLKVVRVAKVLFVGLSALGMDFSRDY